MIREQSSAAFEARMLGAPHRGPMTLHPLSPMETPCVVTLRERHPELRGHPIFVHAFRAIAGERVFHVGFGIWDAGPTLPCGAVMERLAVVSAAILVKHVFCIKLVRSEARAKTQRALRCFTGKALLLGYKNSALYDDGMVELMTGEAGINVDWSPPDPPP